MKQYFSNFITVTALVMSLFLLNGCLPAVMGGAAAGGKVVAQDKTFGESVSDSTIWTKIRAGLIRDNLNSLVGSVNVTVHQGRVLLTGHVPTSDNMLKIIRICWDQDGVKEVINELKIDDRDKKDFAGYAKDSWITARIKSKMVVTKNVKSANYTVETIDGIVYLLGIARTQEELDTVTDIAATVSGVEKVVSYVKVQGDLDSRVEKTKGSGMNEATNEDYKDDYVAMPASEPAMKLETQNNVMPNEPGNAPKAENWQQEEEFDDTF
jgi:osmotically-inducible protein OsmY